MKEPVVQVGVVSAERIDFCLFTPYRVGEEVVTGWQTAVWRNDQIEWRGQNFDRLDFIPEEYASSRFELADVTIGVRFHWERKENQRFQGALRLIREENCVTAVNMVRMEDYLTSVISSEMSATSSLELLKAHAVISRSWLLAQLEHRKTRMTQGGTAVSTATSVTGSAVTSASGSVVSSAMASAAGSTIGSVMASTVGSAAGKSGEGASDEILSGEWMEQIKWYDREDHTRFDVCADDHCQRYQGVTKASSDVVRKAVHDTFGEVLMSQGNICDARFSKCCGGATEEFETCWQNASFPYLVGRRDWKTSEEASSSSVSSFSLSETQSSTAASVGCSSVEKTSCSSLGTSCSEPSSGISGGESSSHSSVSSSSLSETQSSTAASVGCLSVSSSSEGGTALLPDLRDEAEAERWIRTSPPAFCRTTDRHILQQVLNNYDQETPDFYRWKVEYTQRELADLVEQNTGWGLGEICRIEPLERGVSGRIWKLKIVGSRRTVVVGKELEIRRILSASHLYSSAFVVDYGPLCQGVPSSFTLLGAGWGHGVGLCQIGAALMSEQGYGYREILQHYYAHTLLERLYSAES